MSRHLVTFVGDASLPETNPKATTAFGLEFRLGEPTQLEVTTPRGETILAKLRGNRHFKVEDAGAVSTVAVSDQPKKRGRKPRVVESVDTSEPTEAMDDGDENDE